ncbi:hypothetical protein RJ035_002702 [Blastomyces gilchristii]
MSELEAERPTSFASWLLVLKMDYRLCWSLRYEISSYNGYRHSEYIARRCEIAIVNRSREALGVVEYLESVDLMFTPIRRIGVSEFCIVSGRQFTRKRGVQEWTEVFLSGELPEGTEQPSLRVALAQQPQAPGEPLHWSLFVARGQAGTTEISSMTSAVHRPAWPQVGCLWAYQVHELQFMNLSGLLDPAFSMVI